MLGGVESVSSGEAEPVGEMEKDAFGGVSSMLAERLLSRTGRGASTLGFRDYKGVCMYVTDHSSFQLQQSELKPLNISLAYTSMRPFPSFSTTANIPMLVKSH